MFIEKTGLLLDNPAQLNYGLAVSDVDQDGLFELVVAGFGFRNLVLKWNGTRYQDIADPVIADVNRRAIGLAAGDIDGDGHEELYILNTDSFGGGKRFGDRLFDYVDGEWTDLFGVPVNAKVGNFTAGRSVACIDRAGTHIYGFFVANYGGAMRLYELDDDGFLRDLAPTLKLDLITGGRALVSLPLVSQAMDIFAGNEMGANFLFVNQGDGTFAEAAEHYGLSDPMRNVRGIAVLDANEDGFFDLVYGNWEGQHRLFLRNEFGKFLDAAPPEMAAPSRVRTVIAADFDNDGYEEIFFNNIGEPNRLFGWRNGAWKALEIGEALEPFSLGTGAAVADLDRDGRLELYISHGESGVQPLTLYHTAETGNNWLRVFPVTRYGAPARGAVVTLRTKTRQQMRATDAGSGYLCQMEPVAHFGLGTSANIVDVTVRWPDGSERIITNPDINQTLLVEP